MQSDHGAGLNVYLNRHGSSCKSGLRQKTYVNYFNI